MKRRKAVKLLKSILQEYDSCLIDGRTASKILKRIETEIGMRAPSVGGELFQALAHVYIDPNDNQWEEVVLRDEKVVETLKRRREAKEQRRRQ